MIGPLLGSFFIHGVGEVTKSSIGGALGDRPGIDLILFGLILILVLAFLPRGLAGLLETFWRVFDRKFNKTKSIRGEPNA